MRQRDSEDDSIVKNHPGPRTQEGRPVSYKVNVVIETDEAGYYAYAPELEGCHSQGATFEEVMANIREAVELYLETMDDEERKRRLRKQILTTSLEVSIA